MMYYGGRATRQGSLTAAAYRHIDRVDGRQTSATCQITMSWEKQRGKQSCLIAIICACPGTLPSGWSSLTSLVHLDISGTSWQPVATTGWPPAWSALADLRYLDMSRPNTTFNATTWPSNQIAGERPEVVPVLGDAGHAAGQSITWHGRLLSSCMKRRCCLPARNSACQPHACVPYMYAAAGAVAADLPYVWGTGMVSLEHLACASCRWPHEHVENSVVDILGNVSMLPNLQYLDLSGNMLTDGASPFLELLKNKSLIYLKVRSMYQHHGSHLCITNLVCKHRCRYCSTSSPGLQDQQGWAFLNPSEQCLLRVVYRPATWTSC
jgi:hypothetical protein